MNTGANQDEYRLGTSLILRRSTALAPAAGEKGGR